eukprot:g18045.t1
MKLELKGAKDAAAKAKREKEAAEKEKEAAEKAAKKGKKELKKADLKNQVDEQPELKEAAPPEDSAHHAPDDNAAQEPKLTEEDIQAAIDACQEQFEQERQRWSDERAELRLMYEQKALLHAQQQCDKVAKYNEMAEKCRDLEKLVKHFREIEKLHLARTQEEKAQRLHTLHRVTRMARLAQEENLGPLEEIQDLADLRARADAVVKLKALEDPTHKIARLIAGEKRMRHPTLNPTLLEAPKSETEQMWEVFGALRELDQSAADVKAAPSKGIQLEEGEPVYHPDYCFEKLYKRFPHNLPAIGEYSTAVEKLRRAKTKIANIAIFGMGEVGAGGGGSPGGGDEQGPPEDDEVGAGRGDDGGEEMAGE